MNNNVIVLIQSRLTKAFNQRYFQRYFSFVLQPLIHFMESYQRRRRWRLQRASKQMSVRDAQWKQEDARGIQFVSPRLNHCLPGWEAENFEIRNVARNFIYNVNYLIFLTYVRSSGAQSRGLIPHAKCLLTTPLWMCSHSQQFAYIIFAYVTVSCVLR